MNDGGPFGRRSSIQGIGECLMRKIRAILILASAVLAGQANAADVFLTPSTNKGGELPSGYDHLTFQTTSIDRASYIKLPVNPKHGNRVTLLTAAGTPSLMDASATNLSLPKLELHAGESTDFQYDAKRGIWLVSGNQVKQMSPSVEGAAMPETRARISLYEMADGNWTSTVRLPIKARDGQVVAVNSYAVTPARIAPENIVHSLSMSLEKGDRYAFVFSSELQKWVVQAMPKAIIAPAAKLPRPTKPHTVVEITDSNWMARISLPETAGDRDRLTLRSTAGRELNIGTERTSNTAPTRLFGGGEYEYLFVKSLNRWELVRSATDVLQAKYITSGNLTWLRTPTTIIKFANANYVPTLTLPNGYGPQARVVLQTQAALSFKVMASGVAHTIYQGEEVAFVVAPNGRWQRETRTIDLLLLYSNKLAANLGESAARAKMYESFRLTNEALENSRANFRYRLVGLRAVTAPAHWKVLGDPLNELRYMSEVQSWRNQARADGIYYEGTEDGCGLAWVKSDANGMVATGSMACGTTVMRHEMGHNMGLNHGGTENAGYAQGYLAVRSVMAGNAIPYYATPLRLHPDTGMWLGIPNKIDAVRAMDERSAIVASFR